jgi:formate--tetrahydrofolate ligase
MPSDIEIARAAPRAPMADVAAKLAIPIDALIPYGRDKAKLDAPFLKSLATRPEGALVLVTAVNPTRAGEGKTTTSIGLGDALARIGRKTAICLREPSLGPCFGQKGGATGGGHAQIVPMEDINLHFTGDFHAITSAHNLLAAMIDNHIHWGNALGIDPKRVLWRRVLDMNDRALRGVVSGVGTGDALAETSFDITAASEVMAILCLADDLADLEARLGRIVVGYRRDRTAVTAAELGATGAMAALLKDAMLPNLVQTLEGNPVLVHGGPFANIAHGCSSVAATRAGLKLADIVVTEAGFGADLGAEKFFDIKCRKAGLKPAVAVLVATVRSLKMNGGLAKTSLTKEDPAALERGCENLGRHIENLRLYGVPVVVAINHFAQDTPAEVATVRAYVQTMGSEAFVCRHWSDGGAGCIELAERVAALCDSGKSRFAPLYTDDLPLLDKIEAVAQRIYRADGIVATKAVSDRLARWQADGFGHLPVCIAKTQYSFTTDPSRLGAPTGHVVPIREVRLAAGAGFVVAICGDILTMPGLPRTPAAERIGVDAHGDIFGVF